MALEGTSQIIAASVVPVAIISASGLLCLAFYNRLTAVVVRLRSFQRERFQEQEFLLKHRDAADVDARIIQRHQEFLHSIQSQVGQLLHRARILRLCLLSLLLTIALLILSSLAMGLSIRWSVVSYAAVPLFVGGMLMMFVGIGVAIYELLISHETTELEQELLQRLGKEVEDGF